MRRNRGIISAIIMIVQVLALAAIMAVSQGGAGVGASGSIDISGTVAGPSGDLSNVSIYATTVGGSTVEYGPITSGQGGIYNLYIDAGTYDIHFVPPGGSGLDTWVDSNVTFLNSQTINAQLSNTPFSFSGVLSDQNNNPLYSANVCLSNRATNPVCTTTDDNGNFSITISPGKYALSLSAFYGARFDGVESFSLSQDVNNPSIDLTGGDVNQNLQVSVVNVHALAYNAQGYKVSPIGITGNALSGTTSLYPGDPGTTVQQVYSGGGVNSGDGGVNFGSILGSVYDTNQSNGSICASLNSGNLCISSPLTVTGPTTVDVPNAPPAPYTFSGILTDQLLIPISNASICLTDQYNNISCATSDFNGNYSISVEPGMYALSISDSVNGRFDGIQGFNLAQNRDNPTIDLTSGNVTQNLEVQTANIHASAFNAQGYKAGSTNITGNALSGTTSLYPGDPGTTVQQVVSGGGTNGYGEIDMGSIVGAVYNTSNSVNSGSLCANLTTGNICISSPLTVTGPTTVDVPNAPPAPYTLSGIFSDQNGMPITNAGIAVSDVYGNTVSGTTDSNGDYNLSVEPGTYSISAENFYNGRFDNMQSFNVSQNTSNPTIEVTNGNVVQNLQLDVAKIHVYVLDSNGNPTSYVGVSENALSGTTSLYSNDPGSAVRQITGGGSFDTCNGLDIGAPIGTEFSANSLYAYTYTGNTPEQYFINTPFTVSGDTDVTIREGSYSNILPAPTNIGAQSPTSTPNLTWGSVSGAVSYKVYRNCSYLGTTTNNSYVDLSAPQGNVTYYVQAVDDNGVASDPSSTINVEVTAPAPTYLSAASPTQYPNLSWAAASGATTYNIYRNGTMVGTTSSTNYIDNSAPEGTDSYYVTAINGGGESGQSNTVSVLVDRTVPTITYSISPSPNSAGWNDSPATVTFTCTDNTGSSGISSCSAPQTESTDGTYTLTGYAEDNAGNTASVNVTINLDQTPPTLGTPSWSANPVVAGNNTTLTVPASDNLSGVVGGEYYLGSTDPGQGNGTSMTYDSSTGNFTTSFGSSLAPGTYSVNIRAEDAAGNWCTVTTATLTVNPSIPSTPTGLTVPSPTNQSPALTWTGSTYATSYNVYRNGTNIGSTTNTTYTDTAAPQGTDTYYITAVNSAGESGKSNTVSVLYDTAPPIITYTLSPTPNSAGWNNTPVTVTFSCSDAGAGVAACTAPVTVSTDGANQTVTGTATDSAGNTATVTATVNLDTTVPMVGAPNWSTNPVVTGNTTMLTAHATATDSSPITGGEYYIGNTDPGQGSGTAMTYTSSTGDLTANVSAANLMPGSYQVNVRTVNAAGTWSPIVTSTLVVNPATVAPAITSASSYSIGVRQIVTPSDFTVTATGTPTPTLSESGTLPSGLSFTDNGNGTANFTGMVAAGTAGTYPITITATNSAGTVSRPFTLTITDTTSAPTTIFTNTGSDTLNATVGANTTFTFTATGSGTNQKLFVYSGTLPAGMNLHDNKDGTGTISGTPTTTGTYTFTIEAENKLGVTYQTFTIVVG